MPEGRESPSPETQSGKQLKEVPGSGQRTEKSNDDKEEQSAKSQLDNLESNPKGVTDDEVTKKFAKSE
ncbi:hypothetical protein G7046_g8367 [Stylonectria norvegica]|nr:hypothetical protein G7046_g8367 [Stylonectria norvegica]